MEIAGHTELETEVNSVVKDAIIRLTSEEESLFETLEQAAVAFETGALLNKNADIPLPSLHSDTKLEIRIAGGWVRDKLLNIESHDVDIALNCMSGLQFATIVQQHLLQLGNDATNEHGKLQGSRKIPKIGVIAANPSQSKHLETATMTINSIDCDFVHLRGEETYSSDSRIPTTSSYGYATPLDDALRRDFTLNSLFYNLRERVVEDWTGRGVDDLSHQILVTPLNAGITFRDDPLRVLRAVRFAVRYNFSLADQVIEAASDSQVHDSLYKKVSRERVGKEVDLMLAGKNAKPDKALSLITSLNLAACVFAFPPQTENKKDKIVSGRLFSTDYEDCVSCEQKASFQEKVFHESAALISICGSALASFYNYVEKKTSLPLDCNVTSSRYPPLQDEHVSKVNERMYYLAVYLAPVRSLVYIDHKKRQSPLSSYIVSQSLKFRNVDTACVSNILQHVDSMRKLFNRHNEGIKEFNRLETGLLLRQLKDSWVTTLLVAALIEQKSNDMEQALYLYSQIIDNGLDKCWSIRPLLDGHAIKKSLNLERLGPEIGTYMEEMQRWMLMNPDGSKTECEIWLKDRARKRALEISSLRGNDEALNKKETPSQCKKKLK